MLKLKTRKKFLTNIFLFLFLLVPLENLFNACDTTEPTDNLKPGRRDYTWTVDTLPGLNNPRFRMWGSSPTDVWATTTSNWDVSISHFNGSQWYSYGVPGIIKPFSIFGFSIDNVFIGAENGKIWRFDGHEWNLFAELSKDGQTNIVFDNIWGETPNNFYAFGAYPDIAGYANNSVIAHYTNSNWVMINTIGLFGIVEQLYKNPNNDKFYLQVIGGREFTDSTKIYEYLDDKYNQLYGNVWTQGLQADISLINNEVIFVLGAQIDRRINNQFKTILNVSNPNFYQRIWGRNTKDIFLLMTDGLAHYNGTDVEYLFYFSQTLSTQIFGAALFEKDAFFLVYEAPTGLSLVYHGRLE